MKRVLLKSLLVTIFVGFAVYFYYGLPTVSVLKQQNPKSSALMELRDPAALVKLPEPERRGWQKLWQEVQITVAEAGPRK